MFLCTRCEWGSFSNLEFDGIDWVEREFAAANQVSYAADILLLRELVAEKTKRSIN